MSQFCTEEQRHHSTSWSSQKTINSRFQVERNNQTVKQNIRNILKEKKQSPNHWCQVLGEAAYKKNIAEHETTKQTPYELVFAIPPWKETKTIPDKKRDQHSTMEEEEEECEDVDAEPAPKRACYSLIKSTKEIRASQQEKARNTQRKYNNKMTTRKPNNFIPSQQLCQIKIRVHYTQTHFLVK